ncbi:MULTISPECIES: alpha/beta fold hydrolase [unclassified Mesorhizobium]|uniref:alpha/beta fold hydrolase n=1 Tax=unclassified Mesorhizobium TaxID=325217 RepID=UPI001CD081EE|nr:MULTISPECIES: alpha/beta hydrolase [unclassified Mesorhizobium]MCA0007308.1 alpha/beta hydrolase [Mesorhizobium sp. B264B1B]
MSEPTQLMVETNGIRLNVAEQGDGPLVFLCHGFPESWYSWRHQLSALAAAGFHAVAPDMRGYGKSDRPEAVEQYTLFHLVGDTVGLLDALEAPTAIIAGHDWGAVVAWHAALMRPDRFQAVIGLSVPFRPRAKGAPNQRDAANDGLAILPALFPATRHCRSRAGAGPPDHGAGHALRCIGGCLGHERGWNRHGST